MRKSTLVAAAAAFSVGMFASGQVIAGQIMHHVSGGGMNTGFPPARDANVDQSEWTYGFTALEDVEGKFTGQANFIRVDDSRERVHVAIACLNVVNPDDYENVMYPAAVIGGVVVDSTVDFFAVGDTVIFGAEDAGGFDRITTLVGVDDGEDPSVCREDDTEEERDRIDGLFGILEEWINGNVTIMSR